MRSLIFAIFTLFSGLAQASFYAEGELVAPITLQDQFEQEVVVDANTQVLLFSRGMKGGDIINEALEHKIEQAQTTDGLVYVADISGMPSLIARFVAIPKMKDLPFSMALDREGEATSMLPAEKDMASLIKLDNLTIISVETFDSSESLLKAL